MTARRSEIFRSLALALMTTIGPGASGLAQGPAATQGFGQTPAPKARPNDLLKSSPFDRLTLIDNTAYEIEPIAPRPLPPLEKKEVDRPRPNRNDPFIRKDTPDSEQMLVIHMIEGEPSDFKVKRSSIKELEYFEDMLLLEADRQIKDGEFTRAFERLQLVKARDPKWRGLDERINRLLFEEGSASLLEDNARGLRLLTDLQARNPAYPGLSDRLASSYASRIGATLEAGDFALGRRLIKELDQVAPGHVEARGARAKFVARAKSLVAQGEKSRPADRVDRLAEASRVWPELDGLEAAYREAFRVEPTLAVAVDDLPEPVGPFPNSPASTRASSLVYLPLLAADDEEGLRGELGGQLLAGFETSELGKGLKVRLKLGPGWSDGSRPVTAIDVARSLADRAVPASPGYNARWAELLDRIEATQDDRVEIKLTRACMKPETWLLGPVGPAHAASDGWVSSLDQGRKPVGDGPYRWESSNGDSTLLQAVPPVGSEGSPTIRRIREVRFANPAIATEAFFRGEVALMEHVPPELVASLAADPEHYKLGRYSTPSVHRLALDGRKPALRNRKLRRALSLAIDRRGLLEEVILRRPPDDANLVADGPFVRGSFVDSPGVEPFEYNPLLAKGLASAAMKELGGNPIQLTLEYPSTPEARATCPRMAEAFRLIGVEITLVERLESELEAALHAGRRFDLAYRASRPSLPLRDAGTMLVPGYDAPAWADALASSASPRILGLLLQLDRAPETTSARTLALQIDRESRDELPVLPLWQLEDHYAWRANLRGPLAETDQLYRGIAGWEVEPWYIRD